MTGRRTAWSLEGDRLLTPEGDFVARLSQGVLYFYVRKRKKEVAFTMSDWWQLVEQAGISTEESRPSARAWGRSTE